MAVWKKQVNRLLCLVLLGLVLLSVAAPGACARAELPCDLTVDYTVQGVPVPGAVFRLYRLAELNDRYEPIYTGEFSDVRLDNENLEEEVLDLYTRVVERQVQPECTFTTDETGQASVSDLIAGVFLLEAEPVTLDGFTYYVDKQIVSLPIQREGQWKTDLVLQPKSTRLEEPELIPITVVKRWEDKGYESQRPNSVSVSLLLDGKTVSTVVLSEKNNWTHTWTELLPNGNWSVKEDVPKNYSASVERQGDTFLVTNHRKTISQTGQIWWPVLTAGALGLVLILLGSSLLKGKERHA